MPKEGEEDIFDKEISADSEEDEDEYEVEKIVSDEWDAKKQKRFYWVKWVGYPSSQNTREPEENLKCPALLEAYKEKKERRRKEVYDQDSGDEDFIVPDDQSPSVDLSSKSAGEHRHEKKIKSEKKSSKYSDQTTSSSTLSRLLKNMKRDNKSPRSSYPSSSKREKKHRIEKDSSSTSSKDSSRSTSLRPESSSTLKDVKNKRKRLSTVDEEESNKITKKKKSEEKPVVVKRLSSSPTSNEDSNTDEEPTKKSSPKDSEEKSQLIERKTSSIVQNSSSSSSSLADLFQKYKKKKNVEEARKLKRQKSEENEKLENEKRIEKSKNEALQEYLSSQSDTDGECSSTNNLKETSKSEQKRVIISEDSSSITDVGEENFSEQPTSIISEDKGKEDVGGVEKMNDDIADTSPDEQLASDYNDIVETENIEEEETPVPELTIENQNEEQQERVDDDIVNDELVKGLEEIDRLFEYKVENTVPTTTEEEMPKRTFVAGDDDYVYSDNESQETEQMDLQIPPTPKSYAMGDSTEEEQDFTANNQMSSSASTSNRKTIIPSTAGEDFYQRLLDGTIEDWENEPELTDNILEAIPMEEQDPPDYEPMEPISVDGPMKGKVHVFNSPDQKNGFDRGWQVESILGIAAGDDNKCIVKFIGFSTPQKLPYGLVKEHALQDYFMYHQWIGCKINPTMRGAYWDKKLRNPSSWMTPKALTSFKQWKEQAAHKK
ncbi:hypothetical protein ACQ4LE_003640 [Meloidogyne hapla]